MASLHELEQRLAARFSGVPGVTDTDLTAWLTEASYIYGYSPTTLDTVPDVETPLVLLLAQIQGARAIAFSTAHYFKYTDAEESVDKTKVSEQYLAMVTSLTADYVRDRDVVDRNKRQYSTFHVMRRLDRDYT